MSQKVCPKCGARVDDDMVICGNCGKILPKTPPKRQTRTYSQKTTPKPPQKPVQRTIQKSAPARQRPQKSKKAQKPIKEKTAGKISAFFSKIPNLKKILKITVIVLAIYFVISAVQIFRVRFSTYDFSTDMKMTHSNYGDAIDSFFESGHWSYNPFTFTVKYTGESQNTDYKMKFSAIAKVNLKEVEVNGTSKTGKKIEPVVMGMFI
ncbi:MAG: zinc ribbon domain-containing protein [Oscillospiraceae bacterium]